MGGPNARNVFQHSIDRAFASHLETLFNRFASELEIEAGSDAVAGSHSAIPSARKRFERSFAFARATHSQMSEHLRDLREEEL